LIVLLLAKARSKCASTNCKQKQQLTLSLADTQKNQE